MRLSKRLELVASFVEQGGRAADIGTDHGYIPIALVKRGAAEKAIAMDVRPGPLERAKEHIRQYGLEQKIETRLSDGAKGLAAGEADTVIIAGMGGELVIHILEGGRHLWESVAQWILSPQSELEKVRKYLEAREFDIVKEAMVEEDGKYYTVMKAVRKGKALDRTACDGGIRAGQMTEAEYLYGPRLIEQKDPTFLGFLGREEGKLKEILNRLEGQKGERAEARRKELKHRLLVIQEAKTQGDCSDRLARPQILCTYERNGKSICS